MTVKHPLPLQVEKLVEALRDRLAKDGQHVSVSQVQLGVCRHFGVGRFTDLRVGYPNEIPALENLQKLESDVYLRIHTYVQCRAIGTLKDLEGDLAEAQEVSSFDKLRLGPLLRHPLVLKHFQPAAAVREVPNRARPASNNVV